MSNTEQMINAERSSEQEQRHTRSGEKKHRKRKERFRTIPALGSPKRLVRLRHPMPTHESLSDWEDAS